MASKGKGGRKSKSQEEPQVLDASTTEDGPDDEHVDCFDDDEGGFRYEDIYIPPAPQPTCSLDTTAPRLIITHIQNENFKSYAGVQVIGPLHKSFTSIVGPNGSGKSNVIDSMLFVFGYRAAKIRSKKISVLLHNSEQHQNVKSCTVTVYFQLLIDKPGEDFELVENSKIAVSRTAFKDNSSFYTINGRKVHFKEVAKLLRNHGIDLDHNRFLILQGEVEQIAMMKPIAASEHETGMLEFLEDIIGTSRFKEPLKKLFARVEALTEERADKLARVKIVEDDKLALEEVKNEAIEFLEIENEITQAENILFQRYLMDQETALKEEEEKTVNIRKDMDELEAKLKDIQAKKEAETKKYEEANKILEGLDSKHEKIKAEFDRVSKRHMTLQEDIVHISAKRKKTKLELKQENVKLLELRGIPEKNKKTIEELVVREAKLSKDLEKEVAAKDKLMEGLGAETKGLKEEKEKQESILMGLKAKVDEAKAPNNMSKKELEIYLSNEQKEQAKLEQITANLEQCTEKITSHKPRMKELTTEITAMEKELEKAQAEFPKARDEERASSEELRLLRINVEETKSSMNASRSRGRVLDFLMRLKAEGSLPGIYGRLGDLGAIDKKYDIAVSTACGVLDHIIVDSKKTGQECVRLLKQHDVGRATFLILEEQNHLQTYCDSKRQYPENALRLFDLIKIPDQKFRTAFYYGCRETLVANDLTQASRIGYGHERFRVVTLNGEMIEIAGTMSGGGRPCSGRMGQSVAAAVSTSPAQIEALERNLSDLGARNNELRQKYRALEEQLKQLPNKIKNKKIELGRLKTEVQSAVEQEPALKEQLVRQKQKVKEAAPDPKEVKRLQAAVEETQKTLDAASAAAEKINSKVKKLHSQIMEVTGGRVTAAQKKVNEVNQQVEKVRQEITRLNVAIKTSERNAKKSADKIESMEQEVSAAEANMLKMKAEIDDIGERGKVIMAESHACNKEIDKRKEEDVEQKQLIADISKEENEAKSLKLEVQGEIDKFTKAYQLQKEKVRATKRNIRALKLHNVPGKTVCLELKEFTREELYENTTDYLLNCVHSKECLKVGKKPNLAAIEEYRQIEVQYNLRIEELEKITQKRTDMREIFDDCRKKRHSEFMAGYSIITSKLKEMYQMITLGGDAELELVDSFDPFSEGVIFSVRPPKKSWKSIANLSGGEKTLSSLALVFALHFYKPSPLYVMDEIDAALDFKNVSIVGNYIKERTKNAQFIIISLRANMFELADRLVGIYKTYNATKSCVINPRLYGRQAVSLNPAEVSETGNPADVQAIATHMNEIFDALHDQGNTATNRGVLSTNNVIENKATSVSPGHGKKVARPAEIADTIDSPLEKKRKEENSK